MATEQHAPGIVSDAGRTIRAADCQPTAAGEADAGLVASGTYGLEGRRAAVSCNNCKGHELHQSPCSHAALHCTSQCQLNFGLGELNSSCFHVSDAHVHLLYASTSLTECTAHSSMAEGLALMIESVTTSKTCLSFMPPRKLQCCIIPHA